MLLLNRIGDRDGGRVREGMTAASPTCWPMVCFVGIIDKLKDALFGPDVAEIKPAAVKVEPVQTRPTQVAPEVVAIRTVPLTARRPR